jgi:hypothetical protein
LDENRTKTCSQATQAHPQKEKNIVGTIVDITLSEKKYIVK